MRKFVAFVASLAIAISAPVAFHAPAQAAQNPAIDLCSTVALPNWNLGECVAFHSTQNLASPEGFPREGFYTQMCRHVYQNYPLEFGLFWDTLAECVQAMHQPE